MTGDWMDYLNELRQLPKTTRVYAQILDAPSKGWEENQDVFGPFPGDGALLLYTRLPSSNHSVKDK